MNAAMERVQIEFIQSQSLPWLKGRLWAGAPPVGQKLLSGDDTLNAFTAAVRLKAGWHAEKLPQRQGACELFVLTGRLQMQVGEDNFDLIPGGYLRIENQRINGSIKAVVATELLYLTAIGPEPVSGVTDTACTFVDSKTLDWEIPWVLGPNPGLKLKLLWRSEETGAYTRLIKAEPGWSEDRQEHHDCIEEVYMLSGDMAMGSRGTMTAGGYIWRPAGIKHGPMITREGGLMFIRTDGPLKNYYTDVDGTPLNY